MNRLDAVAQCNCATASGVSRWFDPDTLQLRKLLDLLDPAGISFYSGRAREILQLALGRPELEAGA